MFLLYLTLVITALKVSVFGVILVRIFPHLDQNKSEYRHTFYAVCHLAINSDKSLIQFLKINRGHLPNDALITLLMKQVSEVFFTRWCSLWQWLMASCSQYCTRLLLLDKVREMGKISWNVLKKCFKFIWKIQSWRKFYFWVTEITEIDSSK